MVQLSATLRVTKESLSLIKTSQRMGFLEQTVCFHSKTGSRIWVDADSSDDKLEASAWLDDNEGAVIRALVRPDDELQFMKEECSHSCTYSTERGLELDGLWLIIKRDGLTKYKILVTTLCRPS